uniref:ADF-H domain-containing protein n=1 Tax=Mesocestoides corti TaxID=53468 RepID=A0A5K3G1Z6_MESCO
MSGIVRRYINLSAKALVLWCGVAADQGADILDHLAAANPVSLCVPVACEEDKQPTR